MAPWAAQLEARDLLKLQNDIRTYRLQVITTIAQFIGGFGLIAGLYFTWANLKTAQKGQTDTLRVTTEGQITDRFIRAVDQLGAIDKNGNPAREIRLGGIYGFRRIARGSPGDYEPIREILMNYILINARSTEPNSIEGQALKYCPPQMNTNVYPPADIQAALTFLGETGPRTSVSLNLHDAELRGANLEQASLQHANLIGVDLRLGWLVNAHFECSFLNDAHLEGANLEGAHLEGALLDGTNLECADWKNAHLERARLYRADLNKAMGLTQRQVDSAYGDPTVKLPSGIRMPESWTTPIPADSDDCR